MMKLRTLFAFFVSIAFGLSLASCDSDDNILQGNACGTVYLDTATGSTIVRLDHIDNLLKGTLPFSTSLKGGERIFVSFTANYSNPVQTIFGTAYPTDFLAATIIPDDFIYSETATKPTFNDTIPLIYTPWITYDPTYGDFITLRTFIKNKADSGYKYQLYFNEAYSGGASADFTLYYNEGNITDATYTPVFQSFRIPSTLKNSIVEGTKLPIKLNIRFTAKQSPDFTITSDSTVTVDYYPTKNTIE